MEWGKILRSIMTVPSDGMQGPRPRATPRSGFCRLVRCLSTTSLGPPRPPGRRNRRSIRSTAKPPACLPGSPAPASRHLGSGPPPPAGRAGRPRFGLGGRYAGASPARPAPSRRGASSFEPARDVVDVRGAPLAPRAGEPRPGGSRAGRPAWKPRPAGGGGRDPPRRREQPRPGRRPGLPLPTCRNDRPGAGSWGTRSIFRDPPATISPLPAPGSGTGTGLSSSHDLVPVSSSRIELRV